MSMGLTPGLSSSLDLRGHVRMCTSNIQNLMSVAMVLKCGGALGMDGAPFKTNAAQFQLGDLSWEMGAPRY